jgi:hypothetical protein
MAHAEPLFPTYPGCQSLAILNWCFGSASESRNNCKFTVDLTVTMGLWAQHGRLRAPSHNCIRFNSRTGQIERACALAAHSTPAIGVSFSSIVNQSQTYRDMVGLLDPERTVSGPDCRDGIVDPRRPAHFVLHTNEGSEIIPNL